MIIFLFLPTTNIYVMLGLVIVSIFFQKKLHDLNKDKIDHLINIIDQVIEEKLLEEQNNNQNTPQEPNQETEGSDDK